MCHPNAIQPTKKQVGVGIPRDTRGEVFHYRFFLLPAWQVSGDIDLLHIKRGVGSLSQQSHRSNSYEYKVVQVAS